MSEGGQYKIVFCGKILDGLEIGEVKKRLAAMLAVDGRKIDRLFEKSPVTVKKNIDYPTPG